MKQVLKYRLPNSLIFALTLISLTITAATGFAQAKKEALDVIGARYDFGYVAFGSIIKHRAVLINRWDSVVNITRVVPGCGCTQIPLKTKVLAPGDSVEIEMIFDTGKIQAGIFEKAPVIFTDNRETPRVTIRVSGFNLKPDDLQPQIKVEPQSLTIERNQASQIVTFSVYNGAPKSVFARVADGPQSPYLEVTPPVRQILPGLKDSVTVKLLSDNLAASRSEESITLVFNDMKQTRWTIPVLIK
ncbi:MAG: DUF1573 domain-containing protein [Candidatus Zixiibacteriota bacterium]